MKLLVLFAVALGALSITSQASDATEYRCVADKKAGFVYNNKLQAYDTATFEAGKTYIISVRQLVGGPFVITEVGKSRPSAFCPKGFDDYGFLFCDSRIGEFRFNKYNGRFIHIYAGGHYDIGPGRVYQDDQSTGPYLEIGTCSDDFK